MALIAALALPSAAAAQFCPVVPCVSLFPCERLVCVDHRCVDVGVDCRDDDPCTIDSCDNDRGGCVHDPYCPDDGAVCNGSSACAVLPPPFVGIRCLNVPLDCDDGDACSIDSCVEPSGCRHVPLNCDDGDQCTTDRCDRTRGCLHETIAGCCRTVADCPTDACHSRRCIDRQCTSPKPVSCDDGDASTVDTCDPARGCLHAPATAPPPAPCARDGDCPADSDPCTTAVCERTRGCAQRDVDGFEGLACVCQRPSPQACSGVTLPRKLASRVGRACATIGRARVANEPQAGKLVRRARRQLERARRAAVGLGGRRGFSQACSAALGVELADGVRRADALGVR
jgi:hypothetical protein